MRQKAHMSGIVGLPFFAVLLASCAVVLCAAQGIFGIPFRKTVALAAARFVPVEGFAYATPMSAQYTPTGA
jgi:hypothetical protein